MPGTALATAPRHSGGIKLKNAPADQSPPVASPLPLESLQSLAECRFCVVYDHSLGAVEEGCGTLAGLCARLVPLPVRQVQLRWVLLVETHKAAPPLYPLLVSLLALLRTSSLRQILAGARLALLRRRI